VFDESVPLNGKKEADGCFIIEDATDAQRLIQSFSKFRLPVVGSDQLKEEGDYFVNRKTGAPATIWSVEIKSMEAGRAIAYVKWYASPDAAGGYTLNLVYDGVRWLVISMMEDWIS